MTDRADELLLALANAKPNEAHHVAEQFLLSAWRDGYSNCLSDQERVVKELGKRTTDLLHSFSEADKGYAFNDGGYGTMYAEDFASLLEEWIAVYDAT